MNNRLAIRKETRYNSAVAPHCSSTTALGVGHCAASSGVQPDDRICNFLFSSLRVYGGRFTQAK